MHGDMGLESKLNNEFHDGFPFGETLKWTTPDTFVARRCTAKGYSEASTNVGGLFLRLGRTAWFALVACAALGLK